MCGIAGILRLDRRAPDAHRVEEMLAGIAHRGPDGSGQWSKGPIALGHVRLSVIDLSDAAAQPMTSASGRLVITYNGEVYNFAELRSELGAGRLQSSGDTAVVVEYVEQFGIDRFVERAEGFFAFGMWDNQVDTLTLARDRHGIKPLFMRYDDDEVRFASETWPLTGDLEPDPLAIASMLAGRPVTTGARTLFRDVHAIIAGEIVTIKASDGSRESRRPVRASAFHDPDLAARLANADDGTLLDEFESAFRKSVRLRMTSDAPVACLASGGIDSSLVAAIAKDEGFDLPLYHADVTARSERTAAEVLARHLGAELIVETTNDDAIVGSLAAVTRANEMPLSYHINAIPFYLLARRVSLDGVKVILTGEGADEYLLGYPQYGVDWAVGLLDRVRAPLRRAVRSRTGSIADRIWFDPTTSINSVVVDLMTGMEKSSMVDADLDLSHLSGSERDSMLRSLRLVNAHLLSTLHRNDRLGMAWGLECRFPFLGHEVARVCLSSPAKARLRRGRSIGDRRHPFIVDKWLVREFAGRWLPPELAERPKMGFPVSIWDRTDVRTSALLDGRFANMFGLGGREVEAMSAEMPRKIVFRCLLAEVWLRTMVDRTPRDDIESFLEHALVITPS